MIVVCDNTLIYNACLLIMLKLLFVTIHIHGRIGDIMSYFTPNFISFNKLAIFRVSKLFLKLNHIKGKAMLPYNTKQKCGNTKQRISVSTIIIKSYN